MKVKIVSNSELTTKTLRAEDYVDPPSQISTWDEFYELILPTPSVQDPTVKFHDVVVGPTKDEMVLIEIDGKVRYGDAVYPFADNPEDASFYRDLLSILMDGVRIGLQLADERAAEKKDA